MAREALATLSELALFSRGRLTIWVPGIPATRRTGVRAARSRRRAQPSARRADATVEVAVAVSSAGQSPSSTRTPSRRTASPCVWCVCGSAECRSCCRWPGNRGTASAALCVCGSGANDWSLASRRRGISITPGC